MEKKTNKAKLKNFQIFEVIMPYQQILQKYAY